MFSYSTYHILHVGVHLFVSATIFKPFSESYSNRWIKTARHNDVVVVVLHIYHNG